MVLTKTNIYTEIFVLYCAEESVSEKEHDLYNITKRTQSFDQKKKEYDVKIMQFFFTFNSIRDHEILTFFYMLSHILLISSTEKIIFKASLYLI